MRSVSTFLTIGFALTCCSLSAEVIDSAIAMHRRSGSDYISLGQMHELYASQHARLLQRVSAANETLRGDVLAKYTQAIRTYVAAAEAAFTKAADRSTMNPGLERELAQLHDDNKRSLCLCNNLEQGVRENEAASELMAAQNQAIQQLTATYSAAEEAAGTGDVVMEEWDQPGHGVFSD
jgi:hypothetical protein